MYNSPSKWGRWTIFIMARVPGMVLQMGQEQARNQLQVALLVGRTRTLHHSGCLPRRRGKALGEDLRDRKESKPSRSKL